MIHTTFQVFSQSYKLNLTHPWMSNGAPSSSSGSGFAIEIAVRNGGRKGSRKKQKLILTNAHVVKNEKAFVQVAKWNSSKKYVTHVLNFAPEVDMAILQVQDEEYDEFWKDIPIMPLTNSPPKGEEVRVVGFPLGGQNASITKGIVSRIDPMKYFRVVDNMTIQIDAAVNPGNSGGPVFDETGTSIVGIAFMHTTQTQGMCNMIPEFIISHYLTEVSNGGFDGVCDLDLQVIPLDNLALHAHYLPAKATGVLITKVSPVGAAGLVLQKYDVLSAIDNISVSDTGTVFLDKEYEFCSITNAAEQVPYWHAIRMKHPGDKVTLTIYRRRDGNAPQMKKIKCTMQVGPDRLVPILEKNISRDYFVLGGLIFQPLNGRHIGDDKEKYWLLPYVYDELKQHEDEQIVVLSEVIPINSTSGLNSYVWARICKINGEEIRHLDHMRELCNVDQVKLEMDDNVVIIVDTKQAAADVKHIAEKLKHNAVLKHKL